MEGKVVGGGGEEGEKKVRGKVIKVKLDKKFSVEESRKEQDKFFIDVSKDEKGKELINNLLTEVNVKKFGREIILRDLVLLALPKLTQKDFEAIRLSSLSDTEKMEKECFEYNQKNGTNYEMGYYFVHVRNVLKEGK